MSAPQFAALEGIRTVLRVGTGDSGEGLKPHQEIIARFEKANADIVVKLESVAGSDYYQSLLDQAAKGDAPDIMQIGDDAVPMFVQQGAFVELGPDIKGKYPLDPGIYLPGVFQPGAWQGRQYLLPKDFSPLAVYYNKRLFSQYNIPYPKDGWTWDDFLKTAQALTRDTDGDGRPDVWGVQLPAAWPSGFEYWVTAAGSKLISEDGKKFEGYMDSPATLAALQFYADLYNRYKVAPPPVDIKTFGGGNTEFANAQAAMLILGRWPQADLRARGNIELGVVGMPAGKERANVLFWSGFGIYSGSQHKEEAWRFLRFYAGEEGAKIWKDWALPTVRSVAESSGMTKDPIEGVWFRELNYLAPRAFVFTPYWGETAEPALREVMEKAILDPKADVGTALKQAARQAQAALDAKR
jgi:multiple sugar transport system substrate-binding protein